LQAVFRLPVKESWQRRFAVVEMWIDRPGADTMRGHEKDQISHAAGRLLAADAGRA